MVTQPINSYDKSKNNFKVSEFDSIEQIKKLSE